MLTSAHTSNIDFMSHVILQTMQDGVIVIDQHSNINGYNEHAMSLLGIKNKKFIGHDISRLIPEIRHPVMHTLMLNNSINIERNKQSLSIKAQSTNCQNKKWTVIFIQNSALDEIKHQQATLNALKQLTSNIAHEIRNPLSTIDHASQLLSEDTNKHDTHAKRMLEIITSNLERIDLMIKDVLEANHIDAAKMVEINLNSFLKAFHEHFCEVEKIPGDCFTLKLSQEVFRVKFNPMHLDQILWNLCRNGWQHSTKQVASLRLAISSLSQDTALLTVTNDGLEISSENRTHLFEPFFTTKSEGSGLGLYISKQLCTNNHAQLSFDNSNQQTTFLIQLPFFNSIS